MPSALRTASSLMGLQLFSRLFTFVMNQALFRMVSPTVFGTAAIQFELLLSTILFLSREGVRNALLRVENFTPSIVNVAFIPLLLGLPLSVATSLLYFRFATEETRTQPGFALAIMVYAIAAIVELIIEPMHNKAMTTSETGVRIRAEGAGITLKTSTTFLVLLLDSRSNTNGLIAFAAGQLAYSVTVLLVYFMSYGLNALLPTLQMEDGAIFSPDIFGLSMTMTGQSVVKHFLTEGDKFILSSFSPLQDQGGYALAVNYGSLIARIVFQPIEEVSRVHFSKMFANRNQQGALKESADSLTKIIAIQTSLSIIFLTFATTYLPIALKLLLPLQYLETSAPAILSAWVWYVPVLALNGGMEAFLSSSSSSADLYRQSKWMILCSVIYISSAVVMYRQGLGDASLVYANMINLSVRIAYAIHFINTYFPPGLFSLHRTKPHLQVVLVCAVSFSMVKLSSARASVQTMLQSRNRSDLFTPTVISHVSFGSGLALVCFGTWWMKTGRHLLTSRRDD